MLIQLDNVIMKSALSENMYLHFNTTLTPVHAPENVTWFLYNWKCLCHKLVQV